MKNKEQLNPEIENLQEQNDNEQSKDASLNEQQPDLTDTAGDKIDEPTESLSEGTTEPVVEEIAAPVAEAADTVKEEEPAEPVAEVASEPVVEEIAAPAAEAADTAKEEEPAEPVAEVASEPVVEEIAAPAAEAADTAKEEEPAEPAEELAVQSMKSPLVDDHEVESDEEEEEDDDAIDGVEEFFEKYTRFSREQLVEALENLVKEEDVNQIRAHIGYIKASFRKLQKDENLADYEKRLGKDVEVEEGAEEITDPLVERFENALAVYKNKKFVFDQAIEQQKQDNLVVKERILEELRNLIESEEELKKTYDHFRELQEQWRTIGVVPQNSKSTLWNNYHFLVEKFFDKVKINKELKDLDLKKNLEAKTELCEKAEELLLESSITRSFQQLQKLHDAWKETGPVPKDKKDEIWERFKSTTDKLNKRRQDYYDSLRDEQNNNFSAKLILCEKAEQHAEVIPDSPKQWQYHTEQINELFKMWKTIGFAPKKVNTEVWNRFRSSLDTFYRNKKEFFRKYKEHQTENYNQKLNLCLQAEALKENDDWRSTTEELIALQKAWKQIGPVPAKFSDKIWKRFRAACDEFFNKKADHFSNIGEKQDENLKKKLELIDKVKNHPYTDDNNQNLKILKGFQREWMEVGHVPIKLKDKIQNEFRKAVDEQFEHLNISKKVKSTLSFRSKVDNLKGAPNAENLIYKERNFIANKINAIQSDIKIWENNIGFFASSKKADILKAEFEEKIERGRQELALLEEKLKILREQ